MSVYATATFILKKWRAWLKTLCVCGTYVCVALFSLCDVLKDYWM